MKLFLTYDHSGANENKNATPHTGFIRSQSNYMRTLVSMGDYRPLISFSISKVKKYGTLKF